MAAGLLRSQLAAGFGRALGVLALLGLAGAGSAQAIPYFNGPGGWGFDNSTLGLPVDQVVTPGDVFTVSIGPPGSGVEGEELKVYVGADLKAHEERYEPIDRVVELTFQSAVSWEGYGDLLFVFTGLVPSPDGAYEGAVIELESDQLQIARYDSYFFAGFVIGEDELQVGASRTLRYTMSQPQGWEELPGFGVAATTQFIPEPSTAVLFGLGLIGLSVRRRCRTS